MISIKLYQKQIQSRTCCKYFDKIYFVSYSSSVALSIVRNASDYVIHACDWSPGYRAATTIYKTVIYILLFIMANFFSMKENKRW